ncbi:MAG: PHP domain-containing protein [Oscillospiraceae bacterium]|nr:PHP domain-containing protein [Oscillospiraceae bacterium]
MYIYETHMHTSPVSACACSSPAEQARSYKDRGYAGIIVTDHFVNGNSGCPRKLPWNKKMEFFASGYEKAKKEGGPLGLDVFFGWEYNIHGTEFLTYGLSLDFLMAHPEIESMTAARYSAFIRGEGGYIAQAHPYRDGFWIANPLPVEPRLIDGVEVYNAGQPASVNAQAYEFARLHNLPMQAGSDSHHTDIPFTSGIALPKKAESIFDIIAAIKTKQAELIVPR